MLIVVSFLFGDNCCVYNSAAADEQQCNPQYEAVVIAGFRRPRSVRQPLCCCVCFFDFFVLVLMLGDSLTAVVADVVFIFICAGVVFDLVLMLGDSLTAVVTDVVFVFICAGVAFFLVLMLGDSLTAIVADVVFVGIGTLADYITAYITSVVFICVGAVLRFYACLTTVYAAPACMRAVAV